MLKIITLKKRKDFTRITARCHKTVMPAFILQVAENPQPEEGVVRIGYTASRKVGGAVERNRAKRRLREIVRQVFPEAANPHYDYVLIARTDAISRNFEKMLNELKSVMARHKGSSNE